MMYTHGVQHRDRYLLMLKMNANTSKVSTGCGRKYPRLVSNRRWPWRHTRCANNMAASWTFYRLELQWCCIWDFFNLNWKRFLPSTATIAAHTAWILNIVPTGRVSAHDSRVNRQSQWQYCPVGSQDLQKVEAEFRSSSIWLWLKSLLYGVCVDLYY